MKVTPSRLAIIMVLGVALLAQETGTTAAPLPRFASLKSDEVNLRTGPGTQYPVDWVLTYRHMPVKIISEHENWRKIEDWFGSEGWIHHSMLSGRRTILVTGDLRPLRRAPDANSEILATVGKRVLGKLLDTRDGWCEVEIEGYRGWLRESHVWGLLSDRLSD